MNAKNVEIEDFSCELNQQDLNDMRDIIEIGRVSWSPREKRTMTHRDVPVFRLYTPYDPNNSSNVTFDIANALYFPLQPSFYRCCASTGNRKIYGIFEKLVNTAINHYNAPFSMAACILSDFSISPHRHFVDPSKNVVLRTYYWTLTNNPIDCDFVLEDDRDPLYKQGYLEFNPATLHGADVKDGNMRFYVLIDSL